MVQTSKQNKKRILIIGGIILLLVILGILYYYFKYRPKLTKQQQMEGTKTAGGGFNNPGNLRYSGVKNVAYKGEVDNSGAAFKWFQSMPYGYRAIITLYRYYYNYLGKKTLRDAIYTYAPPSDNNPTDTYVNTVASALGIGATDDIKDVLYSTRAKDLMRAVTKVEQGNNFNILDSDLDQAYTLL